MYHFMTSEKRMHFFFLYYLQKIVKMSFFDDNISSTHWALDTHTHTHTKQYTPRFIEVYLPPLNAISLRPGGISCTVKRRHDSSCWAHVTPYKFFLQSVSSIPCHSSVMRRVLQMREQGKQASLCPFFVLEQTVLLELVRIQFSH